MDWARKFIIDNLNLLLSGDNRTETIRLKKRDFFNRNSLRSSDSFTFKELAFETLRYLIDVSRIRSEDDLRRFRGLSAFLTDYTTEHDMNALIGLIVPSRITLLTPDDLGKLSQEDFMKKKEQQFLEAARKIAEEELEKERKKVMEEVQTERQRLEDLRKSAETRMEEVRKMESLLDALPSTINPEDYIKSEEEKEEKPSQSATAWWQRLALTADPFPTKLGLNRIPENKYEAVVVATKIFDDYLRIISDIPQTLYGKTILVAGQFGAGKTTFIQYISYKLVPHKILPFYLVLDPVGDIDVLRQNFYSELFTSICRAMKQRGLADPRPQGTPLDRSTIADLLGDLVKESQIDGYVLMIDGLHKAESTLDASLEFVKQLQNFHEYLDHRGINLCIFVAGSPLWLRKITQNTAYGGSFYRIDEVPTISFDTAYALLQKRIRAFRSPDVDVFLDKDSIRFAYDSVSTDLGGGVTFRAFLDYVIPRLEKGDFKGVGLSVSVDMEDVRKIDRELRSSNIKDSYQYFREVTKGKSRLRRVCASTLRGVYKNRYFGERDHPFQTNKGAFYVLRNAHLIQKMDTGKGLGWTISNDFLAVLDDLNDQGYPPSIVFQAFSIDPSAPSKTSFQTDPILDAGQDFLAKWESEWPEIAPYAKSFLEDHKKIAEYFAGRTDVNLCADCQHAITNLIQCAQIIFKDKQSPEEWLESTWLDIPIRHIINSILRQGDLSGTTGIEYYQRYHQSATIILETLDQLLDINRNIVNILSLRNGREEMQTLFKAGNYLQKGDFEKAIEEINSKIESRIRVAFHLAFSLYFGNSYLSHLPSSAQERIQEITKKGPVSLKRSVDQNLFYHLSRSEYAEVVNEKNIWSNIFERVFSSKPREEVVEALRTTFALDDRKQHRDRVDYFRMVREQIRKAICNADWLLYSLADVLRLSINPGGFVDEIQDGVHSIRVSYVGQDRCTSSHAWKIPISREKEIAGRLMKMSRTLNFSDDIAVSTLFNGTFAEIFIILAELSRKRMIDVQDRPESRMYLQIIPREQQAQL